METDLVILTAASLAAGHDVETAVDRAFAALRLVQDALANRRAEAEPSQPQSHPHRARVAELEDIYRRFGERPPKPGVLAKWIALAGLDHAKKVIEDLGDRGSLAKGAAYVFAAVRNQAEPEPVPTSLAPLADGAKLPSGWVWSTAAGAAVPESEWRPAK